MTDTTNTEVPPAPTPPAPVQERSRRRWVVPLVGGVAVVAALALGGVGGFALAQATDAGDRPGIHHLLGALPPGALDADHRRGPGDRPERPHGDRPERPFDERPDGDSSEEDSSQEDESEEDSSDDSSEG